MVGALLTLVASTLLLSPVSSLSSDKPFFGAQSVNLWRLNQRDVGEPQVAVSQYSDPAQASFQLINALKNKEFPDQWFEQPLDHFDKKNAHTWKQRYWVNKRHYKTGGPVIVLDGGETSGKNRIPFLDTGIVEILANATGGLGVVLEHRYYGMQTNMSVCLLF